MDSLYFYIEPIPAAGGPSEGIFGPLLLGLLGLYGAGWLIRAALWRFSGCRRLDKTQLQQVKYLLEREGGRHG